MYLVLMRENGQDVDQNVFNEYINLEKKYSSQAFENLARGVKGDRGELTRFFRGTDFLKFDLKIREIRKNRKN